MSTEHGILAQTLIAALQHWAAQKADGVSLEEREAGLAKTLRAAWPKGREEPWRYLCESCEDTGLRTSDCAGDATCGRAKPHGPHAFGEPCWCPLGARFRAKPKPTAEDFTQAGRSKPMTRIGR